MGRLTGSRELDGFASEVDIGVDNAAPVGLGRFWAEGDLCVGSHSVGDVRDGGEREDFAGLEDWSGAGESGHGCNGGDGELHGEGLRSV